MPPDIIAGRYRLEREVGRGGMGAVYLCRDERLGRNVAIKQVGGLPGESSMHVARALREARHSAALNHPNVVAIFDAVEDGNQVWLVMEYVPSRTLREMIDSDGAMAPARAAWIGAQVADGLAAAHARDTVHRDVKPSNILVRDDDRALIADFGIARTLGQEQLTRSGLVTGTPAYFSPELARGEEPTTASDVWALGASLYAAVEGKPPYAEQANAIAMLTTIAAQQPTPPRLAGVLERPIARMLDRDPQTRWSMAEAAQELRQIVVRSSTPDTLERTAIFAAATPAPPPEPPPESTRPRTPLPAPVAAAAVAPQPVAASAPAAPSALEEAATPEPANRSLAGRILVLAAALVLALAVGFGYWLTQDPPSDDTDTVATDQSQSAEATPSDSQTESEDEAPADEGSDPEDTEESDAAPPTEAATPSADASPTDTAEQPVASTGSRMQFVEDYYTLLPEDVETGWSMLSPGFQAEVGYNSYRGFWATIYSVSVVDTSPAGPNGVSVTLTYTSARGTEQETREIQVERTGDGYLISGD